MTLSIALIVLCVGFLLLAGGAHYLIDGGVILAKKMGMSSLLIGLTIIAFGTSVPEIFISVMASLSNSATLAVGNALGSNIANIGLVLGVVALITPLQIQSTILKKELPLLFIVTGLIGLMLLDHSLNQIDGSLLLLGAIVIIVWFIHQGLKSKRKKEKLATEYQKEIRMRDITTKIPISKGIFQLILGIILLPISAYLITESASYVASYFHISNLIIGLSIIAIGTSLPELAAAVAGAVKKQDDMVIGNIIGSNIFNILAVLAIPALIHPVNLHKMVFYRDFLTMLGMTFLFYLFAFLSRRGSGKLTRIEGFVLLACYVCYLFAAYLIK